MSRRRREQTDISEVFRLLNVVPEEQDANALKGAQFDPTESRQGAEYRTILTNGTGRIAAHAELE